MEVPVSKRRSRGRRLGCRHATPRLKPNELRSWIVRSLRLCPQNEQPTIPELERILAECDLSGAERVALREELAEVLSGPPSEFITHSANLYKGEAGPGRAA
jgi:hypothetical protein